MAELIRGDWIGSLEGIAPDGSAVAIKVRRYGRGRTLDRDGREFPVPFDKQGGVEIVLRESIALWGELDGVELRYVPVASVQEQALAG